jgi:hypothetical protein
MQIVVSKKSAFSNQARSLVSIHPFVAVVAGIWAHCPIAAFRHFILSTARGLNEKE